MKARVLLVVYPLIVGLGFCPLMAYAQPGITTRSPYAGYLFAYFTGNQISEEAIRFAISGDGYHFRALNNNQPIVSSGTISSSGGVRDPNIIRSHDGKSFFMVATDMVSAKGWDSNRGMVLMRSTDLVHWTSAVVNIQTRYPGQEKLERVWAPQTIYDDSAKRYMVYFSLKYRGEPDKIFYAYANHDFTDLEEEPKQLFYKPDGGACIDADIARHQGRFYLFFKTEDSKPGIKIAVSDHLTSGYTLQSDDYVQQTTNPVEGAGTFPLNDGSGYILMYDVYTVGTYQFTKTRDFRNFAVVDSQIDMNFHPRHGTVMSITKAEARRLVSRWMSLDASLLTPSSKAIIGKDTIGTGGNNAVGNVHKDTAAGKASNGTSLNGATRGNNAIGNVRKDTAAGNTSNGTSLNGATRGNNAVGNVRKDTAAGNASNGTSLKGASGGAPQLILKVRPGTDLHHFDPDFTTWPGISITPAHAQDFSRGAVKYTISVAGRKKTYFVAVIPPDRLP